MDVVFAHLQLEDTPNTIYADKHKVPFCFVVLLQELDKYVKSATTHEHLEGQGAGLVHLPYKCRGFESDVTAILFVRKLGYDWDAANEAQVLLDLDVVQDDHVDNLEQAQDDVRADASFQYLQDW